MTSTPPQSRLDRFSPASAVAAGSGGARRTVHFTGGTPENHNDDTARSIDATPVRSASTSPGARPPYPTASASAARRYEEMHHHYHQHQHHQQPAVASSGGLAFRMPLHMDDATNEGSPANDGNGGVTGLVGPPAITSPFPQDPSRSLSAVGGGAASVAAGRNGFIDGTTPAMSPDLATIVESPIVPEPPSLPLVAAANSSELMMNTPGTQYGSPMSYAGSPCNNASSGSRLTLGSTRSARGRPPALYHPARQAVQMPAAYSDESGVLTPQQSANPQHSTSHFPSSPGAYTASTPLVDPNTSLGVGRSFGEVNVSLPRANSAAATAQTPTLGGGLRCHSRGAFAGAASGSGGGGNGMMHRSDSHAAELECMLQHGPGTENSGGGDAVHWNHVPSQQPWATATTTGASGPSPNIGALWAVSSAAPLGNGRPAAELPPPAMNPNQRQSAFMRRGGRETVTPDNLVQSFDPVASARVDGGASSRMSNKFAASVTSPPIGGLHPFDVISAQPQQHHVNHHATNMPCSPDVHRLTERDTFYNFASPAGASPQLPPAIAARVFQRQEFRPMPASVAAPPPPGVTLAEHRELQREVSRLRALVVAQQRALADISDRLEATTTSAASPRRNRRASSSSSRRSSAATPATATTANAVRQETPASPPFPAVAGTPAPQNLSLVRPPSPSRRALSASGYAAQGESSYGTLLDADSPTANRPAATEGDAVNLSDSLQSTPARPSRRRGSSWDSCYTPAVAGDDAAEDGLDTPQRAPHRGSFGTSSPSTAVHPATAHGWEAASQLTAPSFGQMTDVVVGSSPAAGFIDLDHGGDAVADFCRSRGCPSPKEQSRLASAAASSAASARGSVNAPCLQPLRIALAVGLAAKCSVLVARTACLRPEEARSAIRTCARAIVLAVSCYAARVGTIVAE